MIQHIQMASRFSPNAKEFIPASSPEFVFQPPSSAAFGDAGVRPKLQQKQTPHASFHISEGKSTRHWNIAAPEFKPLASTQLNNSVFRGINKPERAYDGKNNCPELLSQGSRARSSNWGDKAKSSQGNENRPSAYEPRKRLGPSQPKLDRQDVKQKKHPIREETQRRHGSVRREDGNSQDLELSVRANKNRKGAYSSQEMHSQSNMSRQTRNSSDIESNQLSRGPTSTHKSVRSPNERRNGDQVFEGEAYPRLGGSHPVSSDQHMFSGKSWSKVLQSNPAQKSTSSSADNNVGRQKEDKQRKGERKYFASSREQHVLDRGNRQSWQSNGSNPISEGSRNGRPETKGWASWNIHSSRTNSGTWSKHPVSNVDKKQRDYKPYQGNLEWRVDAENARRQEAMNESNRTRIYSNMRAIKNVDNWKKPSTAITKNYRFRNVTDEFRERVKRILFSGSVTNEAVIELSGMNSWGEERGWYDFYQWNTCNQDPGIGRNSLSSNCEGLSPKLFSIVGGNENPNCFQQRHLEKQTISECERVSYQKVAWPILPDSAQVSVGYTHAESNMTHEVPDLYQERSDVSMDRSTVAKLGSNVYNWNRIGQEKSRESLTKVSDDKIERQDAHGVDFIDDEDEWVCVEAKSTIRAKKKERIIANREQVDIGRQDSLDRNKAKAPSIDKVMKGDGGTVGSEIKANQRRNSKAKQGEIVAEKKEKSKKKRKKKKAKEKGKPLYDNDQQKIREFKMREMIEENLKMNLVELTRTRQSTETKIEKEEVEDWPAIGNRATHSAKLMSFSEALKRSKPAPEQPLIVKKSQNRGIIEVDMSELTEEEKMELRRKRLKEKVKQKKKEKKQRKKAEKIEHNEQDSQKKPLTFDLGTMFDKLLQSSTEESSRKSSKKPAKTVLFSSGVISVASGVAKKNNPDGSRANSTKGKPSGNFLDSTQPLKMSGKERETPKKPKKTLLKKIILRAREAKLKAREAQATNSTSKEQNKDLSKGSENAYETETKDQENKAGSSTDAGNDDVSLLAEEEEGFVDYPSEDKQDEQGVDVDQLCKPLTDLPKEVISKLHTRKFREYCDHFLSKDINSTVYNILKGLQRFQTRAYLENPIKAKAKRRLVLGIREVSKHAKMGKLRCAIIAPNLEKINIDGGIDFYLSKIIFNCKQFNIPIIYAMNRQVLGFVLNRKVPVSAIGIFNYSGVEDDFKKLCVLVEEEREKYKERVEQVMLQQSQLENNTFQSPLKRGRINRGEHRPSKFDINPNAPIFIPGSFSA